MKIKMKIITMIIAIFRLNVILPIIMIEVFIQMKTLVNGNTGWAHDNSTWLWTGVIQ